MSQMLIHIILPIQSICFIFSSAFQFGYHWNTIYYHIFYPIHIFIADVQMVFSVLLKSLLTKCNLHFYLQFYFALTRVAFVRGKKIILA